ncbi:hypothetical protein L1049_016212 [Liquidambar formosana]|uniref:Asn/Gln amidotransferase domain-containing protein n=1 Tax=Liquidambar formosana TaxID=63359 RepID=A0AAP0RZD4_LIQFO
MKRRRYEKMGLSMQDVLFLANDMNILFELIAKGGICQGIDRGKGFGSDRVLSDNPKQLEQYRGGKTKLQGYFAGQVMKVSKGKANPGLLNKILLEKLNAKS